MDLEFWCEALPGPQASVNAPEASAEPQLWAAGFPTPTSAHMLTHDWAGEKLQELWGFPEWPGVIKAHQVAWGPGDKGQRLRAPDGCQRQRRIRDPQLLPQGIFKESM